MTMIRQPQLLSIKDASKELEVSVSTIYRMFDEGQLDKIQKGARKGYAVKKMQIFDLKKQRGYN
jgi:excisionase family DNA binding protein